MKWASFARCGQASTSFPDNPCLLCLRRRPFCVYTIPEKSTLAPTTSPLSNAADAVGQRFSGTGVGPHPNGNAPRRLRVIGCSLIALLLFCGGCGSPNDSKANGSTALGGSSAVDPGPYEGTTSGLAFNPTRGVYENPFDVTITHPTAARVHYTLDCSDPRTSTTTITAPLPLVVHVDPAAREHRFLAPGFIIRATVGDANALAETVATHTYLFPRRTVELSADGESPGTGWPAPLAPTSTNTRQSMDYGMDPDVTNSSDYSSQMDAAMMGLPNLSLVTDLPNLFDASTGIYANAANDGVEWERFASLEQLNQDNSPGFQANAGVRIRGGFSRKAQNPKHSFRVLFKGIYGTPKLKFPLFGSEGPSEFDKVDIRTEQNYSWAVDGADFNQLTMTRDAFSRDLQRELGQPHTRGRFYHLYLDGVYWGLYQTQERSEAKYAESYFGGASADYDTIKTDRNGLTGTGQIIATDGDLTAWNSLWQLCQTGFANNDAYYRLEGMNASGTRDTALQVWVDIDNLIDYMLVIFYTANFDAPVSKWFSNKQANNFYAVRNRVTNDKGFVFFAHDSEHTLMADPIVITTGVDEDRVNIGAPGGATGGNGKVSTAYRMNITDPLQFNPQWLHFKLTDNALYKTRFSARAHELLEGSGKLSVSAALALHQKRVDEVSLAIIAESARWGDAQTPNQPRTKNADFAPAVARINDGFLAKRTPIVIAQLTTAGLY